MAVKADIKDRDNWFKDQDCQLPFTVFQDDGTTPQNITDWTLVFFMAQTENRPVVLTKEATITDAATGKCIVQFQPADTVDLPHGVYRYGLWRTDDGSKTVVVFGDAALQKAPEVAVEDEDTVLDGGIG